MPQDHLNTSNHTGDPEPRRFEGGETLPEAAQPASGGTHTTTHPTSNTGRPRPTPTPCAPRHGPSSWSGTFPSQMRQEPRL